MIIHNKNAELNWFMVFLLVALIAGSVMLFSFVQTKGRSIMPIDTLMNLDGYNICVERSIDKSDIDNDGIIDACDICVINMTKDEWDSIKEKLMGNLENHVAARVSFDYPRFTESRSSNDRDGDGIIDGCDSNPQKPARRGMMIFRNLVEYECRQLEKESNGCLRTQVRDTGYGYKQCILRAGSCD
ncbi:MAG: hypothetical protein ACMXYG_07095 [Candidatus Woesearchaeota archaeon]